MNEKDLNIEGLECVAYTLHPEMAFIEYKTPNGSYCSVIQYPCDLPHILTYARPLPGTDNIETIEQAVGYLRENTEQAIRDIDQLADEGRQYENAHRKILLTGSKMTSSFDREFYN